MKTIKLTKGKYMTRLIQVLLAVLFISSNLFANEQIKIVGSSTVYPFTTVVAEQFGKAGKYKTPVVESTGTGGGMKLFCGGVDLTTPSATNASRAIKEKEAKLCEKNGVSYIEIMIGNDGIAFINGRGNVQMNVTKEQLWQAMADKGSKPARWSDIDPSLPNQKIAILTPPPTSGTRDAWNELVMLEGCAAEVKKANKEECTILREDGAVIEAGENDTLLIQKVVAEPEYFAILGFSYLDNAKDKIQAATIEGKTISLASIQSYEYPVARPLFVYFKKEHIAVVPGLDKFIKTYVSSRAIGPKGYLVSKGLVPLDKKTLDEMVKRTK
jgi:phosphate transport system substrate-binding protein